jgi:hypothetical protein
MEDLAKAIDKPKLDLILSEAWRYTPTPPHSRIFKSTKSFRPVRTTSKPSRSENIVNVFSPTNIIEFIRIPRSIDESANLTRGSIASISSTINPSTIWSGNTNYVTISSGKIRDETHYHEDDLQHPDEGYHLTGGFVDPIVTTEIDEVKREMYNSMKRTNTAIQLNTQVEQLFANIEMPSDWENMSDTELEDTLPTCINDIDSDDNGVIPIGSIHGVGEKTIARMAHQFGTYHRLAEADPSEISQTNNFYDVNEEKLISIAKVAVKAHEIWQHNQKTKICDEDIEEVKSYPKKHPNISVINRDAGTPSGQDFSV